MRASPIQRRLERLAAKIRPNGRREFTLEELCREWWRLDQRGFLRYLKTNVTGVGVFADMFQREDAERAARQTAKGHRDRGDRSPRRGVGMHGGRESLKCNA